MIAEIIETKKTFEPIEIKLVIESEEEFCDFLNRLNMTQKEVEEAHIRNRYLKKGALVTNCGEGALFTELNKLAVRYDLVL